MQNINGVHTVEITIEVEVGYSYYPGCPMSMYGGSDHVGWPAESPEVEVTAVYIGKGKNQIDIADSMTSDDIDALEEKLLEEDLDLEPDEDY